MFCSDFVKFYGFLTEHDLHFIREGFGFQGNPTSFFIFSQGVMPAFAAAAPGGGGGIGWTQQRWRETGLTNHGKVGDRHRESSLAGWTVVLTAVVWPHRTRLKRNRYIIR